jgi:chromosome segregation protein
MYLKRIELIGFKSFANKTSLVFDVPGSDGVGRRTGITAVVGPNGSGKSNVADAIRWVMGEQSVKSLRGKKSHDVIFAGSKGKARQNYAEVTLYFDNSDKRIPISYSEISVSRKIYRDGEGEYKINGAKVRMLDVVDLLAMGGIGKESHCVLNQGMSDAILNANPFERRSIVEEAAGVKPFQIKRERSLRKLAVSREHMDRTQELLNEIEPRLRLLRRQAKKAEQRESLEKELRELQMSYYWTLWSRLEGERAEADNAKMIFGREVMRFQREIDTLYEKKEKVATALSTGGDDAGARHELGKIRELLSNAERQQAMVEGRLEIEKERSRHQRRVDSIPVDLVFVAQGTGFDTNGAKGTCTEIGIGPYTGDDCGASRIGESYIRDAGKFAQ